MLSPDMKALIQSVREAGLKYIAEHPEEFTEAQEEEGWCHGCQNARTILVCARGHRSGCDCDEIEVPCHDCR